MCHILSERRRGSRRREEEGGGGRLCLRSGLPPLIPLPLLFLPVHLSLLFVLFMVFIFGSYVIIWPTSSPPSALCIPRSPPTLLLPSWLSCHSPLSSLSSFLSRASLSTTFSSSPPQRVAHCSACIVHCDRFSPFLFPSKAK